ncbi:hypothetical protein [Brachybacterium sp. YJGR34]|uniref:hypothetical protein n=1 Tax=Brachybacterium sp. YJGR34 TaxID=2059911 RepID=UPI000E0ABD62|nr:hypothetical protein [Brachybacterium sp. YJGR34]
MSQPPQSGWGQPPSGDQYGQQSPADGYGQQGYGQQGQGPGPQSLGPDVASAPMYGGDTGAGSTPQGGAPSKNSTVPIIICAGCAVLALVLVLVGGGIFLFTRDGGEGPSPDPTTTLEESEPAEEPTEDAEPTEEEATEEEATEEEPTEEEPTEEEAASGDKGTQDDPYAIGEMFTLEDGEGGTLDVTIGEVNWDATDAVMETNEFNEEPGDGETYILVPIEMTYHGDGEAEAFLTITVEYVSGGNSFTDAGTVTPNGVLDVGTLRDGGTGNWDLGIIIPEDSAKDGAFVVSALLNFDGDEVWVAAT